MCVPNSCTSEEITSLAKMDVFERKNTSFLAPLAPFVTHNETFLTVTDTVCSRGLFSIDAFAFVCLCFSGLLILLPIIGSVYAEILPLKATSAPFAQCKSMTSYTNPAATTEQDKPAMKSHLPLTENNISKTAKNRLDHLLKCFCLQDNIPAILTTKQNSQVYTTLDGIRVLSLMWIISGHTSQLTSVFNLDNAFEWKARVLEKPMYLYTLSGPVYLGVDSFFLMRNVTQP
ncbi:hypothetical protein FKM82_000104 [Ascaphus truei]